MTDYCTKADIIARLGIASSGDDTLIENIITASSKIIDEYTGRVFSATSETRYFDGPGGRVLILNDDLLSVTSLTNDDDTLDSADYHLKPFNEFPKRWIELDVDEGEIWAKGQKKIAIEGSWGYSATAPKDIWNAAVELACRIYKIKDTAYTDATANMDLGELVYRKGIPPSVKMVLDRYKVKQVIFGV